MGQHRIEMVGKIFGRLTVIEPCGRSSNGAIRYLCKCSCGNYHEVSGGELRRGKVKSCGCLASELSSKRNKTHGGTKERLYKIWDSMKDRCNNPAHPSYENYGGRGIKICAEWSDYITFRDFMLSLGYDEGATKGEQTIERIDVNGDYCPENCRLATIAEQALNRRTNRLLTYKGRTQPLILWAREFNIFEETLRHRLNKGMSVEEALETPVKQQIFKYKAYGRELSIKEWAELIGVPYDNFRAKLARDNYDIEKTIQYYKDK